MRILSSIPLPISLRKRRLTGRHDGFAILLTILFIFWAAKEYGRTAYAQGIKVVQVNAFFFIREKGTTSGMDIQASKDGTNLVKRISFSSTWFLHAERYCFMPFLFLFFIFFVFVLGSFFFILRIERETRVLRRRDRRVHTYWMVGWMDGRDDILLEGLFINGLLVVL